MRAYIITTADIISAIGNSQRCSAGIWHTPHWVLSPTSKTGLVCSGKSGGSGESRYTDFIIWVWTANSIIIDIIALAALICHTANIANIFAHFSTS